MKQNFTLLKNALLTTALFIGYTTLQAQTLVAHYKFDNSLNDETGTYNLSASTGFTPLFTEAGHDGTPNGAVSGFAGIDYLESAIDFEIDGNESRTIVAWIKTNNTSGTRAIVGLGSNAVNYQRHTFGIASAKPRFEIKGTGFASPTSVNTDVWVHVACVYDNANKKASLYVNGALDGSADWSSTVPNTVQTKLRVGNDYNVAEPGPQTRGWVGAMDDVRIYAGAATDAQILSLYTNATLAVNEVSTENLNVYPNPVKDYLYFSTNNVDSVEVYNLLGAKLTSQKIDGKLDMTSFANGAYLIKCFNTDGALISTVKTIKE
ncbi:LamG-like jellyroll fold domain-containing protein [Flavobacterium sp. UMI-01]|uniref:LamG-like jellyroll fold domain-containing protein n=1 Tax=Flavobacterium sp. UMI-01 TaxID=1441053 RepID=UPI001C7D3B3D|nr:LamG-like jellyroll fold domain-containing protein [Flavobacterium sp. UMI-01]GIZ09703.1 hypothetical protein FUMI01_24300 [Flavobacterium sp. UMI-01]